MRVTRKLVAIVVALVVVSSCASGREQAGDELPTRVPATTPTSTIIEPIGEPTVEPTVTPLQIPTSAPAPTATLTPSPTTSPSPTAAPIPTAGPSPTATPPSPTSTPTGPTATAVAPTATSVPPTPTPTSGGLVWVGCRIEPQRAVKVGEILTYTALQNPAGAQVDFVFDHGDNTLDPGRVSKAFYRDAGVYTVRLRWSHASQTGTVYCGQVTVLAGDATPTPTPTVNPPVSISCTITPRRTVIVGEVLTYTAGQNPGNVAVSYVFDHGDGTLDPGPISHAFYRDPGSYSVLLKWSYQGRNGTIPCGVVTVVPAPGTPTPTPTPTPAPAVTIGCVIEPTRSVAVNEILTFTALQSPANVPVQFVFDHGDGTRDATRVSKAFYRDPGSYTVTLDWAHSGKSGTVLCGVVTVTS